MAPEWLPSRAESCSGQPAPPEAALASSRSRAAYQPLEARIAAQRGVCRIYLQPTPRQIIRDVENGFDQIKSLSGFTDRQVDARHLVLDVGDEALVLRLTSLR